MISFKPEVRIGFIDWRLLAVMQACCVWSYRTRVGVEVNSIEDGAAVHMGGSLHAFSLAIDLDTAGDKEAETQELAEFLRRWLDPQFDVLFESTHVHVEWDAHRPPLRKLAGT